MINWTVSSSLLILAVLLVRQIFKGRIKLKLQYALWLLVLLRLLIPGHIGSSHMSFANAAQEGQSAIEQRFVEPVISQYVPHNEEISINEAEIIIPAENHAQTVAAIDALWILEFIWIAGAFAMAMIIILSNLHFYLRLRRSRKLVGKEEKIPVYQCRWLETPCLFGLIHPAIYIAEIGDETELKHIISHEYGHYLHGDHIWSALRSVCLVLHWYNPLVWVAAIVSRRDGELACDEAVVRYLDEKERAEYGRTLLRMTIQGRESVLNMGTTMKGSGKSIAQRIRFIANRPNMRFYTALILILLSAVVAGCAFTGAEKEIVIPEPSPVPSTQPTAEVKVPNLDQIQFDLHKDDKTALRHQERFLNDDGDVEFFLDFKVPELASVMPVLEAEIVEISVEDAKSIAQAVFGTTELYSATTEHTREEIERDLEFARALQADEELMKAVHGGSSLQLSLGSRDLGVILERYDNPEYLSTAISAEDRELLNWEFVPEEETVWEESKLIEACYEMNGISYNFRAGNGYRSADSDYAYYANITLAYDGLDALSKMNEDRAYYEHSSPEAPTEEQFIAAQTEAIRILEEFEPGKWQLSFCNGQQQYNGRYIIEIYAQPVFEGHPIIRQDVFPWIETQEDIRFEFGVDGTLLRLEYQDPMEISGKSTLGNCLDFHTAMNITRKHLRDCTVEQFDYWSLTEGPGHHEGISSKVYIQDMQQGWLRVPMEGERLKFAFEPVISFIGYFESFDENGEETMTSKVRPNTPWVQLNISALDGRVLEYQTMFIGMNGLSRK